MATQLAPSPLLLVEDNSELRRSLEWLLSGEGYAVVTAIHSKDALSQLQAGLRPCLIILNLEMPDGWAQYLTVGLVATLLFFASVVTGSPAGEHRVTFLPNGAGAFGIVLAVEDRLAQALDALEGFGTERMGVAENAQLFLHDADAEQRILGNGAPQVVRDGLQVTAGDEPVQDSDL